MRGRKARVTTLIVMTAWCGYYFGAQKAGVSSLSWGLLFLTGTLRMWHAVVILLLHGAAGVTVVPATQLILHDMVGPAQLQSAIRLNATARYLAILLGPAVGGGLMLLLGPASGLLANVLIYAPFSIFLWTIPYTGHLRDGVVARPAARLGLRDALRRGARWS